MVFEATTPAYLWLSPPEGDVSRNVRYAALARSLVAVVRGEQLTFLAAAIAYYGFVSVIPLLLVTLAVGTAVAGPTLAAQVLALVGEFLTPQAGTLVEQALLSGAGRGGATLLGLAVLFWSSLRVFRGLDIAFSRVYGIEAAIPLTEQVLDAILVVGAIALALGATVVLGTIVPFATLPLAGVLGPLGLVVVLTVVFLPVYYIFPGTEMALSDALPGAVFASGGWTLLSLGFSIYAAQATNFQLYGLLGAVLLVLTWFYFGGLLVLLGAALNAVLAGQRDRQLQQGALPDETQRMSDSEEPPADEDGADEDGASETDAGVATVEPEAVDYEDLADLRRRLDEFEDEIEDRTVHRDELEDDLEQYVRRRVRRGHARDWGPYLVLLYGTAMTLGAFYFLSGLWAVLAMVVVWLSTLGLYTLMLLVGTAISATSVPRRGLEMLRKFR